MKLNTEKKLILGFLLSTFVAIIGVVVGFISYNNIANNIDKSGEKIKEIVSLNNNKTKLGLELLDILTTLNKTSEKSEIIKLKERLNKIEKTPSDSNLQNILTASNQKQTIIEIKDKFSSSLKKAKVDIEFLSNFSSELIDNSGVNMSASIKTRINNIVNNNKLNNVMASLQADVANKAHSIDTQFLHLEKSMKALADKAAYCLKHKMKNGTKIYSNPDYTNKDTAPKDLVYSKLYKTKVSYDYPIYKFPLGASYKDEKMISEAEILSALQDDFSKISFESSVGTQLTHLNYEELKLKAISKGFPLIWVYIGLKDGVFVCIPGDSKGYSPKYDPRERPWYKDADKTGLVRWSPPYEDISGMGTVISCTAAVIDNEGVFYGVTGGDVTASYIFKDILTTSSGEDNILEKYVVDAKSSILLTSIKGDESTSLFGKPLPFTQISESINNNGDNSFLINDGKELITYCKISSLNWYYIEKIDLRKLVSIKKQTDDNLSLESIKTNSSKNSTQIDNDIKQMVGTIQSALALDVINSQLITELYSIQLSNEVKNIDFSLNKIRAYINAVKKQKAVSDNKIILGNYLSLRNSFEYLVAIKKDIIYKSVQFSELIGVIEDNNSKIQTNIMNNSKDLSKNTSNAFSNINSIILKNKTTLTIIGLLSFIIAIGLGVYISNLVTKPLGGEPEEMALLVDKIAKGDLTTKFDNNKVYFGLYNNLKVMSEHLSSMIRNMKVNSETISRSSKEMSTTSNLLSVGAKQTSSQSNNVASATEQMSVNINAMAGSAEEMSVNVNSVATASDELSKNMTTISNSIEKISGSINNIAGDAVNNANLADNASVMSNNAKGAMSGLGKSANEIGKVTTLISKIAERTNLLALNATIEAASAGDAGKGFAVVANEIKDLARQTNKAANEISEKIGGIQENSSEAIDFISEISDVIVNIQTASQKTANATQEQTKAANNISDNILSATNETNSIANSIAEVANGAENVSSNSSEAALAVNDISSNILKVSEDSNTTVNEIKIIEATTNSLNKVSNELELMVEQFKV